MNYNGLNCYIHEAGQKEFCLGTHDCFTFINGAVAAFRGRPIIDELPEYHDRRSARKVEKALVAAWGGNTFIEAMDKAFARIDYTVPGRGWIAARKQPTPHFGGYILGVSTGILIAFVHPDSGLAFFRPAKTDLYWRVE